MERKIGEIFEYNGEWYQCVEGETICSECDLRNIICQRDTSINNPFKECSGNYRTDKKNIIFKKLEKVGEPYERYIGSNKSIKVQRYRLPYRYAILPKEPFMILEPNYKNSIEIEIKQTKEDMEEKKNEELSNLENTGKNLKPFDLEAAKAGKPVCTRDGRKARIICFDAKRMHQPIIALITQYNGVEYIETYYSNGCFNDDINSQSDYDLMMLSEKKEGWVNVYKERIYSTKEEAIEATYNSSTYIDTIKFSWEE